MTHFEIDKNDRTIYPIGLTRIKGGIHISVVSASEDCSLLLFLPKARHSGKQEEPVRINFPKEERVGDVWEMTVKASDLDRYLYAFEADGKVFPDPCGRRFIGREQWGDLKQVDVLLKTPISCEPYDWEDDRPLKIPYEDCIVYRAHVRGFTKHSSSGVADRGFFRGIIEKIPYLQDLGITTLELLPVAEFQEVMMTEYADGHPYGKPGFTGRLNYWGYTSALACAPKASYAGKYRDPTVELKDLVKALHRAGIELVLEMFFGGKESPVCVLEMVRRWVREYHIDGIHFIGYAPTDLLARDPYLTETKLWASGWSEKDVISGRPKHLGVFNEGFLNDMRHVLKGDENQMSTLAWRTRHNPQGWGVLNFIAGTNGFTLYDMVSYEQKHNEANGENNRDGSDYNYTWNCGAEGPVRRKKVLSLRRRQLRNALMLLFLSQGTPVLLAGDEFGNTQMGNNNAYCQDNEVSWLDWRLLKKNKDIYDFVKGLIAFRKEHGVFHQPEEPRIMDYLTCGHPDISYHGVKAWVPEFDNFRRQLGIMYCGAYGRHADGSPDDYFFVAYNMHWEPHEFALPNLPKGLEWRIMMDTSDDAANGRYQPDQEQPIADQKKYMAPARAVVVCIGRPVRVLPAPEEEPVPQKLSSKDETENTSKGERK